MSEVEATIGGGERVQLTINSGSMRPFLRVGDVVELGQVTASELRRGDVVLFRYNNQHIVHRIRRVKGNRLVIRGDGVYRRTELVVRGDVAARATAIIKRGKRVEANTCRWRYLTAFSLTCNFIRNVWWWAKGIIKKVLGIK